MPQLLHLDGRPQTWDELHARLADYYARRSRFANAPAQRPVESMRGSVKVSERILAALRVSDALDLGDLVAITGASRSDVNRALLAMWRNGIVRLRGNQWEVA